MKTLEKALKENNIRYHESKGRTVVMGDNDGVYLDGVQSLRENVTFRNRGYVYLGDVTAIEGEIMFENWGYVDLCDLDSISGKVIFENKGWIYLGKVREMKYRGSDIKLKNIDGYTMMINSEESINGITIMKCQYFGGGELCNLDKCIVVQDGENYSHYSTYEEAKDYVKRRVE